MADNRQVYVFPMCDKGGPFSFAASGLRTDEAQSPLSVTQSAIKAMSPSLDRGRSEEETQFGSHVRSANRNQLSTNSRHCTCHDDGTLWPPGTDRMRDDHHSDGATRTCRILQPRPCQLVSPEIAD